MSSHDLFPTSGAKFNPGRLVITPGAFSIGINDLSTALQRHLSGDWGDLDEHDRAMNEEALLIGGRLLSVYHDSKGVKFYIITEWDRSVTTILLPEEY